MISIFRPASNAAPSYGANYTTEGLTRDVDLKPIHSHNDYWRKRPLFDALSFGCGSVEGDVWLFDKNYTVASKPGTETATTKKFSTNEVYVGHNQLYLEPNNTLWSLYLGPIFNMLESCNPLFEADDGQNALLEHTDIKHGLFYNSPETPLHLMLDIKTDANATYVALKQQLKPFIDNQYLTHYDTTQDKLVQGPLTITLSGNLPKELVRLEELRYMFLDGPLFNMTAKTDDNFLQQVKKESVIVSASLQQLLGDDVYALVATQELSDKAKSTLKNYFDRAHQLGLKTRIWGSTTWPIYLRNTQMKAFWQLGCDLVNADDLEYASTQF